MHREGSPLDREPRKIYVGTDTELAAIIAAVLRWVQLEPALPRSDKTDDFFYKVPRLPNRSSMSAFIPDDPLPDFLPVGDFDLYERDMIVIFGLKFRVWRLCERIR